MKAGMAERHQFLVTCEHGGNRIPAAYRDSFVGREAVLQSHRGFDFGALAVAREVAQALGATLIFSTISRLLVDLNRSPRHPRLHAEWIQRLPDSSRQQILIDYYLPFRASAEAVIMHALASGKHVIHLSSHSFTPELDGIVRAADVGLLYDPARAGEAALCREWHTGLKAREPRLRVRRNYPYTGRSDGFAAYLRRRFAADEYIGVELEINQRLLRMGGKSRQQLQALIIGTLVAALTQGGQRAGVFPGAEPVARARLRARHQD
jgi:predicted N-formylglutamate amidohydrolase